MRRLIAAGLMAATLMPGVAMAQNGELHRDRQEIREQQQDLRDAHRDVREQRHDVREARQDYRGDWRDYRRTNGDAFRGPAYVGPRGWRYRPVAEGYRLQPGFYGERYWIADPYRYRLPAAVGPTRWVRYGNDVLLVNVRSGRVMTVYNSFFF